MRDLLPMPAPRPPLQRFVVAFAASLAMLTWLPQMWWLWRADVLTPGAAVRELGLWTVMAMVSAVCALLGVRLARRAARDRLAAWDGAAPAGAGVLGGLAGALVGVTQGFNLAGQLWSLALSLAFEVGHRGALHGAMFELFFWPVLAAVGVAAGALATALLYLPWLSGAPVEEQSTARA
jgi:hypothetical protein